MTTSFLGIFKLKMSWKCKTYLFLLSRMKQFISIDSRKLFYNAYILPHLDYCCVMWGNCIRSSTDTPSAFLFQITLKYNIYIHSRKLRSSHETQMYIPKPRIEVFRNTFIFSGSSIWNSIHDVIRHSSNLNLFKVSYLKWYQSSG